MNERALVERLEAANVEELIGLLRAPSLEEERVCRDYLGDPTFGRLHELALHRAQDRERGLGALLFGREETTTGPRLGNVVVLPGIMGSELMATERASGSGATVWLNYLRIALGQIERLSLAIRYTDQLRPAEDFRDDRNHGTGGKFVDSGRGRAGETADLEAPLGSAFGATGDPLWWSGDQLSIPLAGPVVAIARSSSVRPRQEG